MGYESKIYVVEKYEKGNFETDGFYWAKVIATFDLSKMEAGFSFLFQNNSNCFIYADDGNTHITEDKYGDMLKQAEIKDVVKYLNKICKNDSYSRLKPCLQMLKGFDLSEWNNLKVLHFGH